MNKKYLVPLDRRDIRSIPSSQRGKLFLDGPFELSSLLEEPDRFQDEVQVRPINVAQEHGVSCRSALVEVVCEDHHAKATDAPGEPTKAGYTLRYLYREAHNTPILGAVELKVTIVAHGIKNRFHVKRDDVIHSVYVTPSKRRTGIARILLAETLSDFPDVMVHPQFSDDGAKLFGLAGRINLNTNQVNQAQAISSHHEYRRECESVVG